MESPRILPLPAPVSSSALPPPSVCHLLHPLKSSQFVCNPQFDFAPHPEVALPAYVSLSLELPGAKSSQLNVFPQHSVLFFHSL